MSFDAGKLKIHYGVSSDARATAKHKVSYGVSLNTELENELGIYFRLMVIEDMHSL